MTIMAGGLNLRLAMAQINAVVGDLEGNRAKILDWIGRARDLEADLVTFPELALTGYPPEDLLLKPRFIERNLEILKELAAAVSGITAVVGFVDRREGLYNAAAILKDGQISGVYHKICLPNYGVFDEVRYFQVGKLSTMIEVGDVRVGLCICEDIWFPDGPAAQQAMEAGAEILINISSSPYHAGKRHERESMLRARAIDNTTIVAYNNMVGGQDELVFDGDSLVFDEKGQIIARGAQFEEDLVVVDLDMEAVGRSRLKDPGRLQRGDSEEITVVSIPGPRSVKKPLPQVEIGEPLGDDAEVYQALVVGTRDYVRKNKFHKVVIGLSGGIDSALTATVAVDALGGSNVVGVSMPSKFSSEGSVEDSKALALSLGIELMTIPISEAMNAYESVLGPSFEDCEPDVAEENLQARIRGNLVMALSNKFGWLVLSTGNKSEFSVGYCTLYGDMAGGFSVLKDVPKTMVFSLAEYCNRASGSERIPRIIIEKPPSAELRPDQKDTDSLPPYDRLDPILQAYVENDQSVAEMIEMGFDSDTVRHVVSLVDFSEYKRRQAAPGVKITPRAFGRDRRMPITNRFGH
jgi:NAD+ synthase (glutamine-hydrolysing)